MGRVWQRAAVVMLLVGGVGCRSSQFECIGDSQCARDGVQGVCQDVGFCSFEDETCESGQRFGDFAAELAGACVATDPQSSTSGADTLSGTGTGTGAGTATATATMTMTMTTAGPTSGTQTTDPVVDTTSGDSTGGPWPTSAAETTTAEVTTDDSESETSGDPSTTGEPSCASPFLDEFNDGTVGPGWQLYLEDLEVVEVDTELRFTLVQDDQSYATLARGPLDVSGGHIQARLLDGPNVYASQLIFDVRTGTDPAHEHRVVFEGYGSLRIIDGGEVQAEVEIEDTFTALDLRIGFQTPGTATYEYRLNDGSWSELGAVVVDSDLTAVVMRFIVGAWDPLPIASDVIRLDTIAGCFTDNAI